MKKILICSILFLAVAFTPVAANDGSDNASVKANSGDTKDEARANSKAGDVVLHFSAPGPSPRDLAWDGKYLWLVDDGTDTIYKLDPNDGTVLMSFDSPGSQPCGLTWDGAHLWNSDDSSHNIYKIDPITGLAISTIDAPVTTVKGEASPLGGLAWDGEFLWSGWIAGWSSRMNQVDCQDGSIERFYFTKGYPRALASNSKWLWNATDNGGLRSGIIYKYDISNGSFISQCDTPGLFPSGLAFDGQCLWCADEMTKTIYKLVAK